MRNRKSLLIVLLIISTIMVLIFQGKAQTSELSLEVRRLFIKALGLSWKEAKSYWRFDMKKFRKLAHTVEYFVLALAFFKLI